VHLTRLALTDFRSYAAADLALDPGVSTLLGANGQGKTNVVEAAGYVSTLGSHRVGTDAPLVRRGAERAILRAAITSAERDSLVEIEINPGRANRARVNRVAVPRPRQVLGILRTVLFAPDSVSRMPCMRSLWLAAAAPPDWMQIVPPLGLIAMTSFAMLTPMS